MSRRDFMQFGKDINAGIGGRTGDTGQKYVSALDDVRQKFTGYQKDGETSLDFAEARMYENRHSRFTAVDPLMASGKSANPQTFNRYIYCLNNPLGCTDPSGLDGIWTYRDRDGGTEWKHFNSQDELDAWNSSQGTEFCKKHPSSCTPYKPWTGGDWVLWADRTAARLNSDGTKTPISLVGYGTDEQWNQLAAEWWAGKGIDEAWQKTFQVALKSEMETTHFRAELDFELQRLPMLTPLILEIKYLRSARFTATATAAPQLEFGRFSVVDWTGYPKGYPRPSGTFRILEGEEYANARIFADKTNRAMRAENPNMFKDMHIHEIKPVKFGGSPTDPANKIVLPRNVHAKEFTPWWNRLQRDLQR